MVAMLLEKDVEEIRSHAKSKMEKFWVEALTKAFQEIMFAAKALYKHKQEKTLDRALLQFSHQISLLEASLSYSRAVVALNALPGTEKCLEEIETNELSSLREALPNLEAKTASVASEWEECFLEQKRLGPKTREDYSAYKDRLFLDQWERSGGNPISHELKRLLIVFGVGYGFHSAPRSQTLRLLLERHLEEARIDIEILADMRGLGGQCIGTFSADDIVEDPIGNEPLSDDFGKALLEKYRRN